nr:homeobox-leucine zipper protein HOX11-like isoform X1 [Ipomoea batatas]
MAAISAYEDQKNGSDKDNNIGFCMGSDLGDGGSEEEEEEAESGSPIDEEPPLQLALLPLSPCVAQPRFPWLSHNCEKGWGSGRGGGGGGQWRVVFFDEIRWWSRKRDMEGDMMREKGGSSNNNSIGSDELQSEINGGLGRKN